MREDFRPILGYEGHYEINSEGVVVSLKHGKRRVLKTHKSNKGYMNAKLFSNGKQFNRLVHRLVWEAFHGKIEDNLLVLHGEGVTCANCCLENLSLGTQEDNMGRDCKRDGTSPKGERNGVAKLTEVQVRYIKSRIRDNEKLRSLAKLFDMSPMALSHIKYGRAWSHVA